MNPLVLGSNPSGPTNSSCRAKRVGPLRPSNQPTVTTDDTRGGATGTTSALSTSAQTEPALDEDQFNRGNSEESNDTGNWGLLGLLGLLAGLRGRKRDRDATVVRLDAPAR